MKTCPRCKVEKSLSEWNFRKGTKDKLQYVCRKCQAKYAKKWKRLNPEKVKENQKRYYQHSCDTPEKVKKNQKRSRRYYKNNAEQIKRKLRRRRRADPEKARLSCLKSRVRKDYGLELEKYLSLRSFVPRCPICNRKFTKTKPSCLDHCHKTGSLRGFLCFKCNTALGLLRDSVGAMQRAILYLTKPPLDKEG